MTAHEARYISLPCSVCGRPVEVTPRKAVEYLGPHYTEFREDPLAYIEAHREEISLPRCLEHSPEYWRAP